LVSDQQWSKNRQYDTMHSDLYHTLRFTKMSNKIDAPTLETPPRSLFASSHNKMRFKETIANKQKNSQKLEVIISIKGLRDIQTVLGNQSILQPFDCHKTEVRNECVNQGVMRKLDEKMDLIKRHMDLLKAADRVVLTGHSLGGTQSILLAHWLVMRLGLDPTRMRIYTFGSPPPGNIGFRHS